MNLITHPFHLLRNITNITRPSSCQEDFYTAPNSVNLMETYFLEKAMVGEFIHICVERKLVIIVYPPLCPRPLFVRCFILRHNLVSPVKPIKNRHEARAICGLPNKRHLWLSDELFGHLIESFPDSNNIS